MPQKLESARHRGAGSDLSVEEPLRARHASAYADGFGRFAVISTLALVPGAGLLAVGRRAIGATLLLLSALAAAAAAAAALGGGIVERILGIAVSPNRLLAIAIALALATLIWCATIVTTAWHAKPERPAPFQAALGILLVATLCLAVALPGAKGVELALVQRDLVTSVFPSGSGSRVKGAAVPNKTATDPWKDTARVNLLLLGSDAGRDRKGVRTDSMIVASIDTKTGNTVLIGLPRNLENVPFPASNPLHRLWPNGFGCPKDCMLTNVWEQAAGAHPDLFPGDPNPGLTTTRGAIGEVLGLRIDAYTIVDLRGFQSLVNAMGGVTVNVPRRLPIGGGKIQGTNPQRYYPITGYIEPGRQRLYGYKALWFSRSRSDSDDNDRMRRQRCMVGSMVSQINPMSLLGKYAQLASVFKKNISTDIQQDELQAWVTLTQRMKNGKITSLPLTSKVIKTYNPDFDAIHAYVKRAITPQPKPSTSPNTSPQTRPTTTRPTPSTTPTIPQESDEAQELSTVC